MELVKQAADMVMEWADGAREAVLEYMGTEKTVTRRETLLTGIDTVHWRHYWFYGSTD